MLEMRTGRNDLRESAAAAVLVRGQTQIVLPTSRLSLFDFDFGTHGAADWAPTNRHGLDLQPQCLSDCFWPRLHVRRDCATPGPFRRGKTYAANPVMRAPLEDSAPHIAGSLLRCPCPRRPRISEATPGDKFGSARPPTEAAYLSSLPANWGAYFPLSSASLCFCRSSARSFMIL